MADVVEAEQDALVDLDIFFDGITDDIYLNFDDIGGSSILDLQEEPSTEIPIGPSDPISSRVNEIERFLLEEEGGEEDDGGLHLDGEDFFADLFAVGSDDGSTKSAVSSGDDAVATPEEADATLEEIEKGTSEGSESNGGEEDDLTRKRRRQLRNRDSAMKSRERKKMYVKDLEMKSRFLESECRRLEHALHCCTVENLALRQCLQKNGTFGVSLAKQESAVLFMESLLLGSLFWLVSIVCLFGSPSTRIPDLGNVVENASGLERNQTRTVEAKGVGSKTPGSGDSGRPGSEFLFMRRRCKAVRTRMKIISMLPITVLA